MASIIQETGVHVQPDAVWSIIREVGSVRQIAGID
jgi:hypothetical protein